MFELLIAFSAGLISFLSPCVLPLIPGYISFISGQSLNELLESRKINLLPLILFSLGFSFVFIIFGATASILGKFLLQNSQQLRIVAGIIIIIFSLQLLGIFNINFLNIEKKISLFFFYNPVNVRYWEIFHIKGNINNILFNKKLAKQTLNRYKGTAIDIEVFDFLQLNSYTLERLSYKDKHKNHTYWYESSHYKKSLGDILMAAMTNTNPQDNTLFNDLLTSDVEENHEHQLKLLNNWREDNLDIVAEILQTIAEKTK